MKQLLLLVAVLLAGCTESVIDPDDLGEKGNPTGGRTDIIFFNREIIRIGIGSTSSVVRTTTEGTELTISEQGFITSPPIGNKVVYVNDSDYYWNTIFVCDLDGNNRRAVLSDTMIQNVTLAPDGQTLAYCVAYVDWQSITYGRIILTSLQNPAVRDTIENFADPAIIPTFSPDGKQIAYATLNPAGSDLLSVYTMNTGVTRAFDVGLSSFSVDLEFDWTPDSKQILCACMANVLQDVYTVDIATGNLTSLGFATTGERGLPIFPVVSPTGSIAVVGYDFANYTADIWSYEGSTWTKLDLPGTTDVLPHFSGDGKKIVYSSINGAVDPFSMTTVVESMLMIYENGASKSLTSGMIVRPLFPR